SARNSDSWLNITATDARNPWLPRDRRKSSVAHPFVRPLEVACSVGVVSSTRCSRRCAVHIWLDEAYTNEQSMPALTQVRAMASGASTLTAIMACQTCGVSGGP